MATVLVHNDASIVQPLSIKSLPERAAQEAQTRGSTGCSDITKYIAALVSCSIYVEFMPLYPVGSRYTMLSRLALHAIV